MEKLETNIRRYNALSNSEKEGESQLLEIIVNNIEVKMCEILNTGCSWKKAAERQRYYETKNGFGLAGTQNYEKLGCYGCSGVNTYKDKCNNFFPLSELK